MEFPVEKHVDFHEFVMNFVEHNEKISPES